MSTNMSTTVYTLPFVLHLRLIVAFVLRDFWPNSSFPVPCFYSTGYWVRSIKPNLIAIGFVLGFPTGRDSATFRDIGTGKTFFVPGQRDYGTKVPSLSQDKGTTGQAQNLATGRDGILNRLSRPVPGRPGTKALSDWQKNVKKSQELSKFFFFFNFFFNF